MTPLYNSVGIVYTRKCPMACRHCVTESSPAAAGKMIPAQAQAYIQALRGYTDSVFFVGGEPLLYFGEVLRLISYANSLGLEVGAITGAGWATVESSIRSKIKKLVEAGLQRLTVSWDVYHEEFGSGERAALVARVAAEEGLRVRARILITANTDARKYEAVFAGIPLEVTYGGIVRLGRATQLPLAVFPQYDSPPADLCAIIYRLVIDVDGQVYACCGPSLFSSPHSPLVLGNAKQEPLEAILGRAKDDPLLELISLLGPHGLYLLLQESAARHLYTPRRTYNSICDLCLDLTNSREIVAALREQLQQHRGRVLVAAARLAAAARREQSCGQG